MNRNTLLVDPWSPSTEDFKTLSQPIDWTLIMWKDTELLWTSAAYIVAIHILNIRGWIAISVACHREGPGPVPGQSMCDFWWTIRHLDNFFSSISDFLCQCYYIIATNSKLYYLQSTKYILFSCQGRQIKHFVSLQTIGFNAALQCGNVIGVGFLHQHRLTIYTLKISKPSVFKPTCNKTGCNDPSSDVHVDQHYA